MLTKNKFWMFPISFCLLFLILGTASCGKKSVAPTSDTDGLNLLKNSSFEQDGEPSVEGWEGISSCNVYRDAPTAVGGGLWCLLLSGGCVWETALYPLNSAEDGGIYELNCWARKEQYGVGGAGISFFNKTKGEFGRSAPAISKKWHKIVLIDTLDFAPGDSIYVLLEAGGGFAGSCTGFFDLVKVIKRN